MPPSLQDTLSALSKPELVQWLRDRGVIVLRPLQRPKSVLVSLALDAHAEILRGYLPPPKRPTPKSEDSAPGV